MKLELFHDETGEPRARGRGRYARLAEFLQSDVQGSRALLRRIARAVEAVEAGEEERWESTGNAYTLVLTGEGARFESEAGSDGESAGETGKGTTGPVSLADLKAALGEWAELLARDPRS
jgi:hypothetical protein